jgi:hypothetical protein
MGCFQQRIPQLRLIQTQERKMEGLKDLRMSL